MIFQIAKEVTVLAAVQPVDLHFKLGSSVFWKHQAHLI